MSTARIEGSILSVIAGDTRLQADKIEVEAAPEQPGTVITLYCGDDITAVYVDRDGEPCDETTVRFIHEKIGKKDK